ncbi:hypothetical protein CAPTEDRAFT_170225 [Capitella teleta]|uniref:Uncharacterized protein n=1 Tax=Capitella teleta TaxID=283909 RepID=R7V911_CAPTE|nr:hypothetical protein CAPTEDRAFT_170225 [Capitella teleta]|eukprot:ELU15059.1 hypothetical protein CAPTEDRAFT_170225 [Capitella teleta]
MAEGHVCGHHSAVTSVNQSLDEMDFERGIWSAALSNETDRLQDLLKHTDPNSLDSSGYSALHYAARNGHLNACVMLLKHGAKVNIKTRTGKATPLMRAAYCGHVEVVKLLLSKGANPLTQDSDGRTALHKACERNQSSVVRQLLMKNGQALSIVDSQGKTAKDLIPLENVDLLSVLHEF